MLHTLRTVVDLLFPPSDAARMLRDVTEPQFCSRMVIRNHTDAVTLLSYADPVVRAAITACKFEHHHRAATLLHTVIADWLTIHADKRLLIQPIPLSSARLRKRGHNQVATILATSTFPTHCTYIDTLLTRTRDTAPQTSLSKTERLSNVNQAFTANPERLRDQNADMIVLVDDVMTTGATLQAAKAALSPHTTIPITCVALAH